MSDPLDILAPSVPNVEEDEVHGSNVAGLGAHSPRVEPFPYDNQHVMHDPQAAYDPYSHAPAMHMPEAGDYNGYMNYGGPVEGGWGVAAAAGAGTGAGAGVYAASHDHDDADYTSRGYTSSHGHSQPGQGYSSPPQTAALAKQREAAMERQRNRQSSYGYEGPQAGGSGVRQSLETPMDDRRTSMSPSTVYQHTDFGSAPDGDEEEDDGPREIPPKYVTSRRVHCRGETDHSYHSIRR